MTMNWALRLQRVLLPAQWTRPPKNRRPCPPNNRPPHRLTLPRHYHRAHRQYYRLHRSITARSFSRGPRLTGRPATLSNRRNREGAYRIDGSRCRPPKLPGITVNIATRTSIVTATISGLDPGETVIYRVKSRNAHGTSGPSNEVSTLVERRTTGETNRPKY